MKIHYFFNRQYYDSFYHIKLVAWLEENEISRIGEKRLCFTKLEWLRIFFSKDNDVYHNHQIEHEFAKNSCIEHYAHTRKDFMAAMKKNDLKPIDRRNYERFRKVALSLYQKQPLVDFSKFKGKQNYTIRQIIGD